MPGTDYGQQFRSALETSLDALDSQRDSAQTQRHAAATTSGHAEQTLSVAEQAFVAATDDNAAAESVYKLSTQGNDIINNANAIAALATQAAQSTTAAVATVAANIKNLADTFDTLASQLAGAYAIASNDDASTATETAAKRAVTLVDITDQTVEGMRILSLNSSVEAARSSATAAALGVQTLGTDMQGLMGRASDLLTSTTAALATRRGNTTAAQTAEKTSLQAYAVGKVDADAIANALASVNGVVNWAVTATQAKSSLTLNVTLSLPSLKLDATILGKQKGLDFALGTKGYYVFAVQAAELPTFTFERAIELVLDAAADGGAAPFHYYPVAAKALVADVGLDTKPLVMGNAYAVVVLREPNHGVTTATAADLSLPTDPVTLVKPFPLDTPPKVTILPGTLGTLFGLQLSGTGAVDGQAAEYRAIIMRKDVYRVVKDDALFLSDLLVSSYYQVFDTRKTPPTANYVEGATDAYGDVIDLSLHYVVLVLLVGKPNTPSTLLDPVDLVVPPPGKSAPPAPPAPPAQSQQAAAPKPPPPSRPTNE